MVAPATFGYNEITAENNAFQHLADSLAPHQVQEEALAEFHGLVAALRQAGVQVHIVYDTPEPRKPDAIFPNNWATYHQDGTVVLYPMFAVNRRWERRRGILELLRGAFEVHNEIDLSHYEEDGKFLEGTGSMIFDHLHRLCYACISVRTHRELLELFCDKIGYEPVSFYSADQDAQPIYHTNVMLSIAEHYAVICGESIPDAAERQMVMERLRQSGKEIIDVSFDQMMNFCCNVLELSNEAGESLLVMSSRSFEAFTPAQHEVIGRYSKIVHAPIYTIEEVGGGGARCMIAEVFLPVKA